MLRTQSPNLLVPAVSGVNWGSCTPDVGTSGGATDRTTFSPFMALAPLDHLRRLHRRESRDEAVNLHLGIYVKLLRLVVLAHHRRLPEQNICQSP